MEVTNLHKGQIFKSLKELCELLNIEYKDSTNSRNKIIKELECYFKFHKDGRKIVIDEIYDTPKEKVDNRGKSEGSRGNNTEGIYGKYIDKLLINYFKYCLENENYVLWETVNMLAERVGMINSNFRIVNSNKYEFKQLINKENNIKMTNTPFYNVFTKINELKRKPIISSLDRLQKNDLITYEMSYIIYYKHENRLPKIGEDEIIKECIDKAKEKFKIKSTKEIMNNEKLKNEYYEYVNKLVTEQIEECDGIYSGFKIILDERILDLKVNNIRKQKEEFNKIIIKKIKEKMAKNKKKIDEEYGDYFGTPNPFWKKYIKEILDVNYLAYTEVVIDYICNLNKKNITYEIENIKRQMQQNIKDAQELLNSGLYEDAWEE
ncbi:hypothetical protein HBE96_17305 [Clostridium sp. P21]|uniref:Uncharacterized protein n=1 Tax=Clostridium muellerianum TaxID=2716538 RepID=A0A7Y0HPM3_9CLOT|nr:hypothetical protein [Clostridium muellerianum]NMM64380.1 hypothetical protein [Clostridium muellerianum]